jgi:hypothetical protein
MIARKASQERVATANHLDSSAPAAKPVSLAPLSFEEAIKGLVAVKPEKPTATDRR